MSHANGNGKVLSLRHKKPEPVRVMVALASHDMVPLQFTYDLVKLTMHTIEALPLDSGFGITKIQGTYVHSARQELLVKVLEGDATHILWIDTDMTFPKDAAMRLLAHDLPCVGINYCQRGFPYGFVALKSISWDPSGVSERLITAKDSTGLEEVEALGFGMVLMRTDVLRACLPSLDEKPWFWFEWISGKRQVGEDVYFCKFLREAGHRIMVDHDLSKLCTHVGQHEYDCQTAELMGKDDVVEALAAL